MAKRCFGCDARNIQDVAVSNLKEASNRPVDGIEQIKSSGYALKGKNDQFRHFIDNESVGVFRLKIGNGGQVLMANPATADLFGYPSVEELLCSPPMEFYESPEQGKNLLEKLIRNETIIGLETRARKKDGTIIPVRLSLQLIRDLHGAPVELGGAIEKIPHWSPMEKSCGLELPFFDNSPMGIFFIDKNAKLLRANNKACKDLGYSMDEMLCLSIADIDPYFTQKKYAVLKEKLKTDIACTFETLNRRKDGSVFPVEVAVSPCCVDGDDMFVAFQTDITEHQRTKAALDKSRTLHREAEHLTKLGYWELDYETYTISMSEEVKRIFEFKEGQFDNSPKSLSAYVHPEDLDPYITIINTALETGAEFNYQHRIVLPGGRIKYIRAIGRAISDTSGRPVRLTGIAQDITQFKEAQIERKKVEKQLAQAQKMEAIGNLAAGISHDFNNILSGLFGYSHLARNNLKKPEKAEKYIDNTIEGLKRASELVRQILMFSRESSHEKQPLAFYLLVKEAIKLLRASIPASIEIREDIDSKATVMADPTKINQLLLNLCTNAQHAMEENGGVLIVGLREIEFLRKDVVHEKGIMPGKYLRLEISDTGHGMDNKILERIFEPYFTTKDMDKGTGLGLAVVYGIVMEHGGHITVSSEIGLGTTFHVYMPVIEGTPESYIDQDDADSLLSGTERILLVDDENAILESTQALLSELGYQVQAVSDADAAYKKYQKNPQAFDLIITDMAMPGLSGLELSRKILELQPGQPIILCSGYSKSIYKDKVLEMGVKRYYEKPMTIKSLSDTIRDVLESSNT